MKTIEQTTKKEGGTSRNNQRECSSVKDLGSQCEVLEICIRK